MSRHATQPTELFFKLPPLNEEVELFEEDKLTGEGEERLSTLYPALEEMPPILKAALDRIFVMGLAATAKQVLARVHSMLPGEVFLQRLSEEMVDAYLRINRRELERERDAAMLEMREGLLREQLEICGHPVKQKYARTAENLGLVLDRYAQDVVDGKQAFTLSDIKNGALALKAIQEADPCMAKDIAKALDVEAVLKHHRQAQVNGKAGGLLRKILEYKKGSDAEADRVMDRFVEQGEEFLEQQT